jgi:hypothetical protein
VPVNCDASGEESVQDSRTCVDSVVLEGDVTARLVKIARAMIECSWDALRVVMVVLERGSE